MAVPGPMEEEMGPSIWQLLIVLVIVLLLFGTKKLRHIGSDLGGAIRSFRSSMKDGEHAGEETDEEPEESGRIGEKQASAGTPPHGKIIEGEVTRKERDSA